VIQKLTPFIGWAGFICGALTAYFAANPYRAGTTFALMIPGMLLSSLHIMFSSRYRLQNKWIHPGYLGVLLSSAPLLLAIYFSLTK
jgi:hypothetical protein